MRNTARTKIIRARFGWAALAASALLGVIGIWTMDGRWGGTAVIFLALAIIFAVSTE